MSSPPLDTFKLQAVLQRMRAGDAAAREELLRGVLAQMERLASKMLRRFPRVRNWAETGDVLQNSMLRLLRALRQVQPSSMREFFGLAATQIRRELIDLARHFHGPHGVGTHHLGQVGEEAPVDLATAPDDGPEPYDLERWCEFHQEVEKLPAEEREIMSLVFYHGWTQADVAELFHVTVRTVQRRWQSALLKLQHLLKDNLDQGRDPP